MENKLCKKCNEIKSIDCFGRHSRTKDGIATQCKECRNNQHIKNKLKRTPIEVVEGFKKCSNCNLDKHTSEFPINNQCSMGVHSICNICNTTKAIKWAKDNPEKMRINGKKYRDNNVEKEKQRKRIYKQKNKHNLKKYKVSLEKRREYKRKNKHKLRKQEKERRENNPLYKLKSNVRCTIKDAFHRACNGKYSKNEKSEEILGCTMEEFKNHIESQFLDWMSWDNYGNCETNEYKCSWVIDHIIPLCSAKNREDIILLNHWSNLQPMCNKRNRDKWKTIPLISNLELNLDSEVYMT